jgi:hypothetical protein
MFCPLPMLVLCTGKRGLCVNCACDHKLEIAHSSLRIACDLAMRRSRSQGALPCRAFRIGWAR